MAETMPTPTGAITTEAEARILIENAPVLVYRVNDNARVIQIREITKYSKLKFYGKGIVLTYKVPHSVGSPFSSGSIALDPTVLNDHSSISYLFANYWHAWAYLQKLKQNRI